MPLGRDVGLGPGDVLDGDPAPRKGAQRPPSQFSAHAYCGQSPNGRPAQLLKRQTCMQSIMLIFSDESVMQFVM